MVGALGAGLGTAGNFGPVVRLWAQYIGGVLGIGPDPSRTALAAQPHRVRYAIIAAWTVGSVLIQEWHFGATRWISRWSQKPFTVQGLGWIRRLMVGLRQTIGKFPFYQRLGKTFSAAAGLERPWGEVRKPRSNSRWHFDSSRIPGDETKWGGIVRQQLRYEFSPLDDRAAFLEATDAPDSVAAPCTSSGITIDEFPASGLRQQLARWAPKYERWEHWLVSGKV